MGPAPLDGTALLYTVRRQPSSDVLGRPEDFTQFGGQQREPGTIWLVARGTARDDNRRFSCARRAAASDLFASGKISSKPHSAHSGNTRPYEGWEDHRYRIEHTSYRLRRQARFVGCR